MQCPSCHFENIPGQPSCVRCRSILDSSAIKIDVHPPRASFGRKQIRRAFPSFRERWNWISRIRLSTLAVNVADDFPVSGILVRLLVPGWAHIYCGYKQSGKIILGVYAALILIFTLTVGSALGTWVLGLALGLHVIAVMHLLLSDVNGPWERFGYLVVVYTALMFMYSVGWLTIQRSINPITIVRSVGQFSRGDVVFSSQAASPNVGRFVYYQLPVRDVLVRRPDGQRRYRFGERAFDRILASEGQSYSISKGHLIVDGVASPLRPANGEIPMDITASGVVPPGHWLILPGTVPNAYFVEPLNQISIVSKSNVDGVLFLKRNSIFSWNFL